MFRQRQPSSPALIACGTLSGTWKKSPDRNTAWWSPAHSASSPETTHNRSS